MSPSPTITTPFDRLPPDSRCPSIEEHALTETSHPRNHKSSTMSREAYQVPSMGGQNAFEGTSGMAVDSPAVVYICGHCASRVSLRRSEHIRCKECGHRVLYKERTKR
jgi:DNA-directed RNA polymerase I, II, and III subunit RPABC4